MFTPDIFVELINSHLPEPHASLMAGMLFGHKYSNMPADFYEALVITGTLHVVALSGTNVTIIIRVLEKLVIPFGLRTGALVTLVAIAGFVLLVGFDPPIVRASVMGGIATLGDFTGKRQYGIASLLFSGGIMLLIWPEWLYSLSFQLSFLATLGIILFDFRGGVKGVRREKEEFLKPCLDGRGETLAHLSKRHKISLRSREEKLKIITLCFLLYILELYSWIKKTFVENLRTTLAAQVFITPILVYNFGRLSVISPLVNAIVLWSVELATMLGILLIVVGIISSTIGKLVAFAVWVLLEYFVIVVTYMSKLKFGELKF